MNSVMIVREIGRAKKQAFEKILLHETNLEAMTEVNKDFTIGEKIVFTRNDKKIGVQNGLTGTIEYLDAHGNIKVKADGRTVAFNIGDYNNIDRGYAQTVIKSQGQTAFKTVYVHARNDPLNTEAFYVAATRTTNEFVLLTNDKERLTERAQQRQLKTSTRDFTDNTISK